MERTCIQAGIEDDLSGILESPEVTVMSSGHVGLEGPVWHPAGYLTFVDLNNNQLLRWRPAAAAVETH